MKSQPCYVVLSVADLRKMLSAALARPGSSGESRCVSFQSEVVPDSRGVLQVQSYDLVRSVASPADLPLSLDPRVAESITHAYESGYVTGHNDTVEGRFNLATKEVAEEGAAPIIAALREAL